MEAVQSKLERTNSTKRVIGLEFTDLNFILCRIEGELDKPYKEWRTAQQSHGRLKVKTTEEQKEAKRKEREKKLALYNAATTLIFKKKKKGELDEEMLSVSGEVLAVNPDFYTLWNFRKESFLKLSETKSEEDMKKLFTNELYFLESCLKINPKSYGTWHHRCFVLETMLEPDWTRELQLCNQFLQYDERNFHCWDYRRFVVKNAKCLPEDEFEFSMSKISNNFSNYSSWHYRSKLLPILFPDSSQPMGVTEDALLKEYELVQNGFFTDPDDQSNWFYHRWLMGRGEHKQNLNCVFVSKKQKRIVISVNTHIQLGKDAIFVIQRNGSVLDSLKWHNQLHKNLFSTTWICDNVDFLTQEPLALTIRLVQQEIEVCCLSFDLHQDEEEKLFTNIQNSTSKSRFSQELSSLKSETLQQELQSINELMEIEADNKWVILTSVLLMKALNSSKYKQEIMDNLVKLEALDSIRVNYYKDLRSKFLIEELVDSMADGKENFTVTLCNQQLTRVYHTELFPFVKHLDFSNNSIKSLNNFSHLQNVEVLKLDSNVLESCEGLDYLPRLRELTLSNNNISDINCLKVLQTCTNLELLDVKENPLEGSAANLSFLQNLLPEVHILI